MTTFYVTNPNASGSGSLAAEINASNATSGGGTIDFNISSGVYGAAPYTINFPTLASTLPTITEPVTIDATSQAGFSGGLFGNRDPVIRLRGFGTGNGTAGSTGLNINASNVTVLGFAIGNFYNGISIGAYSNYINSDKVEGCFIGTDNTGSVADANRFGVNLYNCSYCVVGGAPFVDLNVISGNLAAGMSVTNGGQDNAVIDNLIGLSRSGLNAIPNGDGIEISQSNDTIGGSASNDGNYISGNTRYGIDVFQAYPGPDTDFDVIQGNDIGLNLFENAPVPNNAGINIEDNAVVLNLIGNGAANVISGNTTDGIIDNSGQNNVITGNYIGTDATGTAAFGNNVGVLLFSTTGDIVGRSGQANVISGNGTVGIELEAGAGSAANSNSISYNLIGTAADGVTPLGNGLDGILISGDNATAPNVIANNTIDDNGAIGVVVQNGSGSNAANSATENQITQNSIYGNRAAGIELGTTVPYANTTGGTGSGPNNLQNYPVITQSGVTGTQVYVGGTFNAKASSAYLLEFFTSPLADGTGYGQGQKYIGNLSVMTDASGNATFSNFFNATASVGQVVTATATDSSDNTSQFSRDVIIGSASSLTIVTNTSDSGAGSLRNAITLANTTATNVVFNIPAAQASGGVFTISPATPLPAINAFFNVDGSTEAAFLGQTYTAPSIFISGLNQNSGSGLTVNASGAGIIDDIAVGNFNQSGASALSLNSDYYCTVYGDYIGVNPASKTAAPDQTGIEANGPFLTGLTIGGAGIQRNVISGNVTGINLDASLTTVTIAGNYIGLDPTGTFAVPNSANGINVNNSVVAVIGSNTSSGANVISGNFAGIYVHSSGGNLIEGNIVGLNAAGTAAVPNVEGIEDTPHATPDTVGGGDVSDRNIVSGNSGVGIGEGAFPDLSLPNIIENNYVGTNLQGTAAMGNGNGIGIVDSACNVISNLISGNTDDGVHITFESDVNPVNLTGNIIGLNAAGTAVIGNAGYGINDFLPGDVVIGSGTAGGANVIAGNSLGQIELTPGAPGAIIQKNYIGTSASGNAPLGGQSSYGIDVNSTGNTISGNTIAGSSTGINLNGSSNLISGNYIGTDSNGDAGLGNLYNGVQITGSSNQIGLGGNSSGQANTIADNGQFGIVVYGSTSVHNTFRGNSIYGSGAAEIDFGGTIPPIANHATSPTTGPNDFQNYPVIISATPTATGTVITGTVSTVSGNIVIDFYASPTKDAAGNAQGQTYLGSSGTNVAFSYNSSLIGPGDYITATATSLSGATNGDTSEFSAPVQVAPLSGPTYYLRVNPANSSQTQIYNACSPVGTPQYTFTTAQISQLDFNSVVSLTIDQVNGNPLGTAAVAAVGSAGNLAALNLQSSSGVMTINATQVIFSSDTLTYSGFSTVTFSGGASAFTLIQTAQPSANVVFNAGGSLDDLVIDAGSFTFPTGATAGANLFVQVGQYGSAMPASVTFGPATTGRSAPFPIYLDGLTILGDSTVTLAPRAAGAGQFDHTTLSITNGINTDTTPGFAQRLNLNDNDLLLQSGAISLSTVTSRLSTGYNSGAWNGPGIDSGTAAADPSHLTALGIFTEPATTSFDGATFSTLTTNYLVKRAYYGDANLSGKVDGSDYSLIDNGYITHLTGWSNGDFNYDGVVNGSDYTLIDNTFNQQGASLASQVAAPPLKTSRSARAARLFSQLPIAAPTFVSQQLWSVGSAEPSNDAEVLATPSSDARTVTDDLSKDGDRPTLTSVVLSSFLPAN